MSTKPRIALMILSTVSLVFVAETSNSQQPPAKKTDIRGNITKRQTPADFKSPTVFTTILIEGEKAKDTGYDKAWVKITEKTTIKKLVGKELQNATAADLKTGCTVEASFVGPVAESYPVQATAGAIVILKEAK